MFEYKDNVVGRGKRHQQQIMDESQLHLVMQVGQLADENSRMDVEIDELRRENRKAKELLERSKGLARMTLLERDGLIDVIKHLKKSWTPPDTEAHYKDKIKPLVDEKVQLFQGDIEKNEVAREEIERILSEKPAQRPTSRKPA